MRLGAHLTISKGPGFIMPILEAIDAECFAFFTRNPQGGSARAISDKEAHEWREAKESRGIGPLIGHLPYTVNLGTPKEELYEFAARVLAEDLRRCDAIGTEFLVVHPGSRLDAGVDVTIERIAGAIRRAFEGFTGPTRLLLETMAGQGSEVGSPAEIARIIQAAGSPDYLGVCIDSCHLFAGGFDLRTHEGIDGMLGEIGCHLDLKCIRAAHLNDSKFGLGSHKDRHAPIGKGEIGLEGIRAVVTHPALRDLPFIVETPVEDYQEYGAEIRAVRALIR